MGLLRYTIVRLLQAIPVLIGVSVITFALANLAPGDPVRLMLAGAEVDEELVRQIEAQYGLDRPLHERYLTYMEGLVQGDLGYSIHRDRPVADLVAQRLGPTLLLVLSAYIFAVVTAIPLGILAAKRRNEAADHVSRIVALFGVSTPSFWIGIMLIIVFAIQLGWLPAAGLVYPWLGPEGYDWIDTWPELLYQTVRHLLLPTIALGTLQMATLMRVERTQMVDALHAEHVTLARAYGVPERTILRKHAFRPAQLPIVTIVGLNLSTALGGAVLIEYVFDIPGLGRLFFEAIQGLDYQLIVGVTMIIATVFVIGVVITDISYAYIDPRVTYGERE